MDIWGSCTFWLLNNAAMNTGIQVFVETFVFISPSCIPVSRTSGSDDNSILNLLRNC